MSDLEKIDDQWVFRHDDGSITARFKDNRQKMVLTHQGTPTYRKVFFVLVTVGLAYLGGIYFYYGG